MLKDKVYDYYFNQDYNCAEALLYAANEYYNLNIPLDLLRMVSGFGGGLGCGKTCGMLSSCFCVISLLEVKDKAHATEGFRDLCSSFANKFEDTLGSSICEDLVPKYKTEEFRCLKAVEMGAEVLEDFLKHKKIVF